MLFHPMDIFIFIAFLISLWAQWKVSSNFKTWSEVPASSGLTGAEVARMILDRHGLHHVPVEVVPGRLSDHYDQFPASFVCPNRSFTGAQSHPFPLPLMKSAMLFSISKGTRRLFFATGCFQL